MNPHGRVRSAHIAETVFHVSRNQNGGARLPYPGFSVAEFADAGSGIAGVRRRHDGSQHGIRQNTPGGIIWNSHFRQPGIDQRYGQTVIGLRIALI
ncbi:hypothetical protein SDC9_172901 [bioreactor metagenome]|uniref:Uncharacterized protein n=1 Tax=bioreactor metagenome TaxID=1076179 RepID=A0A645GH72_9ZZZZ